MQLSDFRCRARLRVRWAEVDMQRIVFNAHYLMYIDTAMMDYWRALALPYDSSMEQLGGELYVKKATLEFNASAREGDSLTIGLRCARVGNSSCQFLAGIFRGEQLLVSGEIIYVFANPTTQRPLRVPAALRDLLAAYEAGDDMLQFALGGWDAVSDDAKALRHDVFVQEHGIPVHVERDGQDEHAVHAVVTNRLGEAVATARMQQQSPQSGQIGRMAVHRTLRGEGIGSRMLEALVQAAQQRGDAAVRVDAPTSVRALYERAGFVANGAQFEVAGVPHLPMQRSLPIDA